MSEDGISSVIFSDNQPLKTVSTMITAPSNFLCNDFRPANILINSETLQITAVLELEFTNAMPAQFACDSPWWLLLTCPGGLAIEEFVAQFLDAMKEVEAEKGGGKPAVHPLSELMRNSWTIGQFWFDFAARKSLDGGCDLLPSVRQDSF
ncbi:hypothetical protein ACJ72_02559 [Emergomyces africanus]|uniref:Aminoglycoside phosphotransferase domain-containing protein n=1 Tax=Emergomyces africanus TaxID=1955775 RepID=A0A1B7P247_9EURO|nr:hypothetical protein ACJ72_02559 [Emergomyces africanus]